MYATKEAGSMKLSELWSLLLGTFPTLRARWHDDDEHAKLVPDPRLENSLYCNHAPLHKLTMVEPRTTTLNTKKMGA